MTALFIDSVEPDQGDISAAMTALPHVKASLARHPQDEVVRLLADDSEGGEELVVPRGAVEMLARIDGS